MSKYVTGKTEHGAEWIRCLKCGRTSFNENDIENKYCGFCHISHQIVETFRTGGGKCPNCGAVMDAATTAGCTDNPAKPEAGDVSICLYCSNWNVFVDDSNIRAMTEEEIITLPQEMFSLLTKAARIAKKVRDERN